MRPGPAAAAEVISAEMSLSSSPRRVVDVLEEIILSKNWKGSASEARELAEDWVVKVITRLRIGLTTLNEQGRPARYAFNSSSDDLIQGACFVEPKDSALLVESKQRRLHSDNCYVALQQITPAQFEKLCGKLIGLLGVRKPVVTRASADEGIDFYGKLELGSFFYPNDLTPTVQKQMDIWLVGQAKHYKALQSGTPELRELVGAIELGRAKVFGSKTSPLDGMDIRVADPVFSVFLTTGTISSNGWSLLRRSGVVGLDGEMIAAFLADRGVGVDKGNFGDAQFTQWLES